MGFVYLSNIAYTAWWIIFFHPYNVHGISNDLLIWKRQLGRAELTLFLRPWCKGEIYIYIQRTRSDGRQQCVWCFSWLMWMQRGKLSGLSVSAWKICVSVFHAMLMFGRIDKFRESISTVTLSDEDMKMTEQWGIMLIIRSILDGSIRYTVHIVGECLALTTKRRDSLKVVRRRNAKETIYYVFVSHWALFWFIVESCQNVRVSSVWVIVIVVLRAILCCCKVGGNGMYIFIDSIHIFLAMKCSLKSELWML